MVKQRISLRDVEIAYDEKIIGGAEEMTVTIERVNEVAGEAGNYLPVEIVGGEFKINGSITRAFVDVTVLNELVPKQAVPPSFTLTGTIVSGKTPGRSMTVFGAVFSKFDVSSFSLTGYAKNVLPFDALDWRFEE